MKKVISLIMMCLMALSICVVFSCAEKDNGSNDNGEVPSSYVDLGLSSGTKWKTSNEVNAADDEYDFFTYDEAVSQFGNSLPTKEQWEELRDECQWSWTGSGYQVTGPNGNFISLPAAGFRDCSGGVDGVGSIGYYWSSTPSGSEDAWSLIFDSGGVLMPDSERCLVLSVRLVQKR